MRKFSLSSISTHFLSIWTWISITTDHYTDGRRSTEHVVECLKSGWTSQFTSSFFMAASIDTCESRLSEPKTKCLMFLCECVLFVLVCVIVWLEFCPGGWLKYCGEQGLGYLVMWERVKIGILKIIADDITKLSWLTEGCRCNVGINLRDTSINLRDNSVSFRTSGILVY